MPSKRSRAARLPGSEFELELIAWASGLGPFPVSAYFLSADQLARLMTMHGVPGRAPRQPLDQPQGESR